MARPLRHLAPMSIESWFETLAVLAEADAIAELEEAESAYATGDFVCGVDAVRALRQR